MERFRQMISSRRGGDEARQGDFLDTMLKRDELPSDEKLDDSEITDNLLTLIIAGQTTTAAAMMWSVKFLDENREAQDKLRVSKTLEPFFKIWPRHWTPCLAHEIWFRSSYLMFQLPRHATLSMLQFGTKSITINFRFLLRPGWTAVRSQFSKGMELTISWEFRFRRSSSWFQGRSQKDPLWLSKMSTACPTA